MLSTLMSCNFQVISLKISYMWHCPAAPDDTMNKLCWPWTALFLPLVWFWVGVDSFSSGITVESWISGISFAVQNRVFGRFLWRREHLFRFIVLFLLIVFIRMKECCCFLRCSCHLFSHLFLFYFLLQNFHNWRENQSDIFGYSFCTTFNEFSCICISFWV